MSTAPFLHTVNDGDVIRERYPVQGSDIEVDLGGGWMLEMNMRLYRDGVVDEDATAAARIRFQGRGPTEATARDIAAWCAERYPHTQA